MTISSSNPENITFALSRLKTAFPSLSSNIHGHPCDLSNPATIESNVENLLKATAGEGKIDHIVSTAGDSAEQIPLAKLTVEDVQQRGMVRFIGPLIIAKHAPKYLSPGPKSSITLTSGTLGARPMKGATLGPAYGSAVEGLMRGLAVDLAPTRVNVVSPGAVNTELFSKRFGEEKLEGVLKMFADQTLVGRVGNPEELAEAYVYLMSCEFVSGITMQVDGGRLMK